MINWIECNLPWDSYEREGCPEFPDLSSEEKEIFGNTCSECFEQMISVKSKVEAKSSDTTEKIGEIEKLYRKILLWEEQHPKVKEYDDLYEKWYEEWSKPENQKSFTGKKLDNPGTLLELENGKVYLIGSVSMWDVLSEDDVIKRYAVVVEAEVLERLNQK